jgi:hypothetical protein
VFSHGPQSAMCSTALFIFVFFVMVNNLRDKYLSTMSDFALSKLVVGSGEQDL